jgi:hypothetical protein
LVLWSQQLVVDEAVLVIMVLVLLVVLAVVDQEHQVLVVQYN